MKYAMLIMMLVSLAMLGNTFREVSAMPTDSVATFLPKDQPQVTEDVALVEPQ